MDRRDFPIRQVNPSRRTMSRISIAVAGVFALMLIGASPLALLLIDDQQVDWNRLSAIGQSYGAISAVLSALAVGGVAVTLLLQHEQAKDARRFAIGEVHRELLRMAITEPLLAKAWGTFAARDVEDPRLVMYANLVLNYLVLLYETDTAPLDEVREHMRAVADSDWMQRYWEHTVEGWRLGFHGRRRAVVDLMDEEFRKVREARRAAS